MNLFRKTPPLFAASEPDSVKRAKVGASQVTVGRFTYGHELMTLHQWNEGAALTIGAFCSIAEGLTVMLGGNHRVDWATTFPFGHIFDDQLGGRDISGHPTTRGDVEIGNDVWLGRNVTVMSGLRIGHGAVIAGNSVVTKDVGDYEIWGGNPAKHIKNRFSPEICDALLSLRWWALDAARVKRIAPLLSQTPTLEIIAQINEMIQD